LSNKKKKSQNQIDVRYNTVKFYNNGAMSNKIKFSYIIILLDISVLALGILIKVINNIKNILCLVNINSSILSIS